MTDRKWVWFWEADLEPLLSIAHTQSKDFFGDKSNASASSSDTDDGRDFLAEVHRVYAAQRGMESLPTKLTYEGVAIDRSIVPSAEDIWRILFVIYDTPFRPNTCNKRPAEVQSFLDEKPIPFGKFLPRPVYRGPN